MVSRTCTLPSVTQRGARVPSHTPPETCRSPRESLWGGDETDSDGHRLMGHSENKGGGNFMFVAEGDYLKSWLLPLG